MELENLPTEDLVGVCENLSLKELSKLSRTSGHISQVCGEIIANRLDQLANQIIDEILALSPTKREYRGLLFPSMRAALLPSVKKLIQKPDSSSYSNEYYNIIRIPMPTMENIYEFESDNGDFIIYPKEINKLMLKYKLVTGGLAENLRRNNA